MILLSATDTQSQQPQKDQAVCGLLLLMVKDGWLKNLPSKQTNKHPKNNHGDHKIPQKKKTSKK